MKNHSFLLIPVILFFCLFSTLPVIAQVQEVKEATGEDLSKVQVDQLSDEDVGNLVNQAGQAGMTTEQMISTAKARGMKPSELVKLQVRIEKMNRSKATIGALENDRTREEPSNGNDKGLNGNNKGIKGNNIPGTRPAGYERIFGFSLFTNKNLSFEPSLNIPTPKNYQLGPTDDLIIDIWGASQATYRQKISPEGNIIISGLGPIYLSGMTIEDATRKLTKELGSIYAGLRGGNTWMKISLGAVRSIKVDLVGQVYLPGTYTLSSLATVFNALYLAGGPALNGSLRDVRVIRDNRTIANLDFYEFLMKGEQKDNVRLEDRDVVFVSNYQCRVEIKGEIKQPGLFDMKQGESLKELIYFAGGFTSKAYTQRVKIFRKTGTQYKVLDIPATRQDTVKLVNGDEVLIDPILSIFENRVEISGAVMRPGVFALDSASTLRQLIRKADGLRGDAFKTRVLIYRIRPDMTTEVIPIDLESMLQGNNDFHLQKEDIISIAFVSDLLETYSVQIKGEVKRPGTYPFLQNMTIEDLILQAGGLLDAASLSRIEIARRIKNDTTLSPDNRTSTIYQFPVSEDLKLTGPASKFILVPFDVVAVRRSPGYSKPPVVRIEGEVIFPGSYSLTGKTDRISDLVSRAGRFTPEAYLKGASLIRKVSLTGQQVRSKTRKTLIPIGDTSFRVDTITDNEVVLGIRLEKIMNKPGTKDDLVLMAGDVLRIPKNAQTVRVTGAVQYPAIVPGIYGKRAKAYINRAGGFTTGANRSKVYVIHANGSVTTTRLGWFFTNHFPKVEPGAVIVVPKRSTK